MGFSNEISTISPEFRNFNGSVELIFHYDNDDAILAFFKNHSVRQTSNMISLCRSIQSQKIKYTLNGIQLDRLNVKGFLHIFAFTHSFKCSVNKDTITEMESSDEKDRLIWLKNCSGIDEFNENRDRSMRILKDTEAEIETIDASLAKIDAQLKIFASTETQKSYRHWVAREKELGHFKRLHRIKDIQAKIKKQLLDIAQHTKLISANKTAIAQNAKNTIETRREIKLIMDSLKKYRTNEHQLRSIIEQYEREKSEINESIQNLPILHQQGSEECENFIQQEQQYQDIINKYNHHINEINAEIEGSIRAKFTLNQEINEFESQIEKIIMNCKQNKRMGTTFLSPLKRNEHLSTLSKKTKNAIGRMNRKINKLKENIQIEMKEEQSLNNELSVYNEKLSQINVQDECNSFYQQQEIFHDLESHHW